MQPYPDQQISIDKILMQLKDCNRLLYQLPTGGGKTAIFSFIAKQWYLQNNSKVLVVAHRDVLISQSAATLRKIGMSVETVVASKKRLNHLSNSYVAMIQTLKNRLKNDNNFLKDVGLIVVDEAHLLMHKEIFDYYPNAKILGVSATPALLKKISFCRCSRCGKEIDDIETCCKVEMFEYSRNFALAEIYEKIIIGTPIRDLIETNRLIEPLNFDFGKVHHNNLKIDAKTNDFDDENFTDNISVANVVLQYEKICKGKKTLIFNASSKVNLQVYNQFLEAGYTNVKIFDSVNECDSATEILNWFKNTSDAILLNVSILTTGFDEPTLEAIIINRATKSISLYHQIVGRGSRVCEAIVKERFIVVDLGGNIEAHGRWQDYVDWETYFYGSNEKPKPKKEALENTTQCTNCGNIHQKSLLECDVCGHVKIVYSGQKKMSESVAVLIDEYPLPDGYKICQYTKKNQKENSFAYSILINQTVDLFIYRNVTVGAYLLSLSNGNFHERLHAVLSKPMRTFAVNFDRKNMRTFDMLMKSIKSKLDKFYNLETIQIKPIVQIIIK